MENIVSGSVGRSAAAPSLQRFFMLGRPVAKYTAPILRQ
jgi:hypothetical protein